MEHLPFKTQKALIEPLCVWETLEEPGYVESTTLAVKEKPAALGSAPSHSRFQSFFGNDTALMTAFS